MEQSENQQNPIRRSIDELLSEESLQTTGGLPAFNNEHEPMNYVEAKANSSNSAKKLMNSLLKFYLSEELIQKNEYIQLKAKVDVMTMAQLIFQMQTAEHAITILMRSIDAGEVSPRMFEVLGGLQKTLLDIMKHQTLHMMAAEENMKKLKRDIDIYADPQPKVIESKTNGTINRGTRNLMKEIQAELGNEQNEPDPTDFDSEHQEDF